MTHLLEIPLLFNVFIDLKKIAYRISSIFVDFLSIPSIPNCLSCLFFPCCDKTWFSINFLFVLGEAKGRKHSNSQQSQPLFGSGGQSNVLPAVEAYQRHELTLLRMEDLLNHGSGSESQPRSLGISGRVQTAAELCHRMVDFCQRLTTAKRKILEDPDLYPEVISGFEIVYDPNVVQIKSEPYRNLRWMALCT